LERLAARVAPAGDLVNALAFGASNRSSLTAAVAADAAGNYYLTGAYGGTVDFGGTSLTAQINQDGFVAKYTSAGVLAWVDDLSGGVSQGVAVDGTGNVYVAGPSPQGNFISKLDA